MKKSESRSESESQRYWAMDNNKFGTTERKFLYTIGKYINSSNGISPRQAKWAHDLYEQAKEEGFDETNNS
jgi:hypothetical protein